MGKARIIWDARYQITDRFRVEARVYDVEKDKKYPEGIKSKFVLIDVKRNAPRLLIDNHAPFGFHIHTKLPDEKNHRIELPVTDFLGAYEEFLSEVERIIKDEN